MGKLGGLPHRALLPWSKLPSLLRLTVIDDGAAASVQISSWVARNRASQLPLTDSIAWEVRSIYRSELAKPLESSPMNPSCRQCGRANPPDANYCYHDGANLLGTRGHGPQDLALAPFPAPLHFPSGETCGNFDQLALGCLRQVGTTWTMMRDGTLAQFLAGMGRADLVNVIAEATALGDPDRGVDRLVSRLPCNHLAPPKLLANTPQVHCGTLVHGQQVAFTLSLRNAGNRLVSGVVTSDNDWLRLDGSVDGQSRLVQFWHDHTLKIHIDGDRIPASMKPREGKLRIDTNAGELVVPVTCAMPIVPFAHPPLHGSTTPRDIALKAKQFPKEAAQLFGSGAVQAWYRANGWIYPVEGEPASGMAAVQQFFEALGLVKPPRVVLDTPALHFQGKPGTKRRQTIHLHTDDKRPVFAFARSGSSWITVVANTARANVASVEVEVVIPSSPEPVVATKLEVRANGNQRFSVPVTVAVEADLLEFDDDIDVELEPFPVESKSRPKRTPRRMLGATLFFGFLAVLIPACMVLLWFMMPLLLRLWSNSPLDAYKAAIASDTILVARVDFEALEKTSELGEAAKHLTAAIDEMVRDLDLQPAGPPRSALAAISKGDEALVVWTFAAPARFGKVLAGRYESRVREGHEVYRDRLDPERIYAIDEKGRLLQGTGGAVDGALKRGRSRRHDPAAAEFVKQADGLPSAAPLWLVASFHSGGARDALAMFAGEGAWKINGMHASLAVERDKGVALHAHGGFPAQADSIACRQWLLALPMDDPPPGFDFLPLLRQKAKWEHRETSLTLDTVLDTAACRTLLQAATAQRQTVNLKATLDLEKLANDQMAVGVRLLDQKDFPRAVESLENCLSQFPNHAAAKQHLATAKKNLAEKRDYDAGLEKARKSLAAGDLARTKDTLRELKNSPHTEAQLVALERDLAVQEQLAQYRGKMKEATAALAQGSLDAAALRFEEARKISAADPQAKRALDAIAWLRKVRAALDDVESQRKTNDLAAARGEYAKASPWLAQGAKDPPWLDGPFKTLRDELREMCEQRGRDVVNDLWKQAQQAAKDASLAAIKEEFPQSLKGYRDADRALQEAQEVLDDLHRASGLPGKGPAPDQARVADRRAEIRAAIDAVEGKALLLAGTQELARLKKGLDLVRAQVDRAPEASAELADALKSLREAQRLKQPGAAELVAEAESLQERLRRLVRPISVDFQNDPLPADWKNDKDRWTLVTDAKARRWLHAEKGDAATFSTPTGEWPANFELDLEFALLNEKIDNSHWGFYADPLVVTLVPRDFKDPPLVIALGNDPTLTMVKRSRLRVGKDSLSTATLIPLDAPLRLKLLCERNTLKVFLNDRLVATTDIVSDFHQLTVAAANPFHPGLKRTVARVAIASIEVRAAGAKQGKAKTK
jgi:hypothetical protein